MNERKQVNTHTCKTAYFITVVFYETKIEFKKYCDFILIIFQTTHNFKLQSNSVIANSSGPAICVCYNREGLCSNIIIGIFSTNWIRDHY
jgi:hypothetical protein